MVAAASPTVTPRDTDAASARVVAPAGPPMSVVPAAKTSPAAASVMCSLILTDYLLMIQSRRENPEHETEKQYPGDTPSPTAHSAPRKSSENAVSDVRPKD